MFMRNINVGLLVVCIMLGATVTTAAMVCYFGQAPDPESNDALRWMIPIEDPCRCTEVKLGGVNTRTSRLPFKVKYYDTFLRSRNSDEIQAWLNCNASSPRPVFSDCPADDINVADPSVTYTTPTAKDADTGVPLTVSCSPSPAMNVTQNHTMVTCRASDAAGNVATQECTFNVKLACRDPLGMESGAIPDSSLSVSDVGHAGFSARRSRLNVNGNL
ncbi:uncharacterized protein LOC119735073 [Patiria miniata]|uniref:HYR domain-containing protein n=1 Tax=Patiria miniata TaxID=46514 RepID=A0A914AM72_PATMI|nr:uncharacterized protein LOC119735073 [Patiria miniata]